MNEVMPQCAAALDESLRHHACSAEPCGIGRWRFDVGDDDRLPARAWIAGEWLRIQTVADAAGRGRLDARGIQQMLQANAALEGGVKFALDDGANRGLLVAEILLSDDPADLAGRVRRACAGLRRGAAALFGRNLPAQTASPLPSPTPPCIDVPRLCSEAGWRPAARPDGRAVVPLEVPDLYLQATVGPCEQGGLQVEVALESVDGAASLCRRAVHVLLLSACRTVRMARAVARLRDGEAEELDCGWEVVLDDTPGASGLGHALAALSVACRLCAREVIALHDETIARKYLVIRRWSSLISNGDC